MSIVRATEKKIFHLFSLYSYRIILSTLSPCIGEYCVESTHDHFLFLFIQCLRFSTEEISIGFFFSYIIFNDVNDFLKSNQQPAYMSANMSRKQLREEKTNKQNKRLQ